MSDLPIDALHAPPPPERVDRSRPGEDRDGAGPGYEPPASGRRGPHGKPLTTQIPRSVMEPSAEPFERLDDGTGQQLDVVA
jgi:hypothetical protein